MDQIDIKLKEYLSFLDNEYVSTSLSLFLVLYAGLAAPKLPERVARLFENTLFRILVFFLIAYSAKKNASVAAIAAVALMVSLQTLNRYDFNNSLKFILRSGFSEDDEDEDENEESSAPSEAQKVMPASAVESEGVPEGIPEGVMESDLSVLDEEIAQEMEQRRPQEMIMEEVQGEAEGEAEGEEGEEGVEGVPECNSGGCNLGRGRNAFSDRKQELNGFDGMAAGYAPV